MIEVRSIGIGSNIVVKCAARQARERDMVEALKLRRPN